VPRTRRCVAREAFARGDEGEAEAAAERAGCTRPIGRIGPETLLAFVVRELVELRVRRERGGLLSRLSILRWNYLRPKGIIELS
jgi:hypothetical protein